MKVPNNNFCVLPWISLEASPIGTVRTCCLSKKEITDNQGTKFSLNQHRLSDIQNSDQLRALRGDFLENRRNPDCERCWAEEDAGRTSKRMHTLNRLKHILPEQTWDLAAKPLMFLDLKLGNICNLKCRICGSWSSSQFAAEEIGELSIDVRKKSYAYQMLQAGHWPRDNPTFWSEIDQVIDQIRYIEFTGGEPFLIQEHFDMLQHIVDRGIAHRVEIHYNTNGTQYPTQAENIWKHFKTVEIAFSIDDVGKRFEYQRSNAIWTEVCNNLNRFKDLKKLYKNIQLQVCTTVNIFNVRYLEDVSSWISAHDFDFVYWNIMHDAWYFSVASLPNSAKIHIADYLKQVNTQYRDEFDRIIDFMNNGISSDGTELRKQIQILDQRRNQDLSQVEPELAEIINYVKA